MPATKLLLLGADTSTMDAVNYAKSIGVHTIVTDYNPKEKVPAKILADEAWMIDVADTDALENRCREEGITAIYAGTHEFCLDQCRILCSRLGLPFYADNDGWKATRDKLFYKQICLECGLDIPQWIQLTENTKPDEIGKLTFPLVVKPADSCAQQGFSIVYDPAELMSAYNKALPFSAAHEIIAEEFIDGDEILVFTYIHEGRIICLGINELFKAEINGRRNFVFNAHYGRYNRYIKDKFLPKFERVVQRLGCNEGACLFQCMYKNGILYNLELGYRLDGARTWLHRQRIFKTSELELMVDLALGMIDEKKIRVLSNPAEQHIISAGLCLWSKPGTIKKITGIQEVFARSDTVVPLANFKEGDTVLRQDNMRSIAYCFMVFGKDQHELDRIIKEINETVHMYDQQDNEMLIHLGNYYDTWCAHMEQEL